METFELESREFIELNNLLKAAGLVSSGGLAKSLIADGQVKVDGNLETRKRCKIYKGMLVEYAGQQLKVV